MSSQGVQLGQWVKARRSALGMTQEQVWHRMDLDIDANYLGHLESGRKKSLPDTPVLIALSDALRSSMTDVLRGAGVLPIDVEESPEIAPGSATIHALVDMIDWVREPHRREAAESLLRTFLDQDQRASRPTSAGAGAAHERQ